MSRVRMMMMSYFFLITILMVFISQTQTAFAIAIHPRYTVHITNDFNNNDNPLVMHCWSRDDDLGVHTLWKTNEWHWGFRNKIFGRTHFWCNMKHGTKEKTIDVYDSDNWAMTCPDKHHCYWSVKDDGFYFFQEFRKSFLKYYDW
ncbi:hypothetical protein ACOSQ2_006609 [Xanthoceras sorbifolium]